MTLRLPKETVFIVSILIIIITHSSCNKELSCEECLSTNQPPTNRPPVAKAGNDTTIMLPGNNVNLNSSVNLNGSLSFDPDNNITGYAWSIVLGAAPVSFTNKNSAQTQAGNLAEGIYQFELKVTDAMGFFSKDTMQVKVNPASAITACDGSIRPQVNAQLKYVSSLSLAREGVAVAAVGNKILFAGGFSGNYTSGWQYYSRVDIFDVETNRWTTAELSEPRSGMATAVSGNKIFFAGGNQSSRVDIYDAAANTWSIEELSIGRFDIAAGSAGDKVVFAGGIGQGFFSPHWPHSPVDIYNTTTKSWSTGFLPDRPTGDIIGVAGISATTVGNKIYFAGNASDWYAWDFGNITSTINVYDAVNDMWSTSHLNLARGFMASIAVGSKNYWAGGLYKQPSDPFTDRVEIRDETSGQTTNSCLFQPNAFFSAVLKDNKIVFFTSRVNIPGYWTSAAPVMNKFDIYDITSNTWSIGVLPVNIYGSAVISVHNTIYVAGGYVNDVISGGVWKLEY